jgi:hypothetical protein
MMLASSSGACGGGSGSAEGSATSSGGGGGSNGAASTPSSATESSNASAASGTGGATSSTTTSPVATTNAESSATNTTGGDGSGGSNTTGQQATNTTGPTTASGCGTTVNVDANPFGCEFAWGANGNQDNRASYLHFITTWVGYEDNGGLNGQCDGCGLVGDLANGTAIAVYYAYHIGYMANEDGFGDCNTDFDDQTLCTRGAQWIRENRDRLLDAYANYARMTHDASPDARVAWLLEGDFVQYTYEEQSQGLSIQELGELATDIVCAIKSNAPGAVVAINHSPWISDELTVEFWNAMPLELIDFVWTTGVGDNDGFINQTGGPGEYNAMSAKYQYLNELTGKGILVDTSFGASQAADSWSNNDAATLNARIAEGVIAANVTDPPNDYQSRVDGLSLDSTCQ